MPLDVDQAPVRGVWFRHVPAGGDPLFRPERPGDARWQRGEVVEGLYLADSEETAWAEWYRLLGELALPPGRLLPRDLWRLRVNVAHVADLSTPGRLTRVKLAPPAPDRAQWPAYQKGRREAVRGRLGGRSLRIRGAVRVAGALPVPRP